MGALMQMIAYGARDIYLDRPNINRPNINRPLLNTYNKTFEWDIKYVEEIDIEDVICSVTMNEIKNKHIKCGTCSKIFDLEVKKSWIHEKDNCPYCRQKWNNYYIYHISKSIKKT
jgi:uncharacterized CHY-type Zn-finger protein